MKLAEIQGLPDLPNRMSCVRWGESTTRSPAQASVGLFIQTLLQWGSLIHRPRLWSALCFGCLLFLSWAVVLSFLRTLFTMKWSPPMEMCGSCMANSHVTLYLMMVTSLLHCLRKQCMLISDFRSHLCELPKRLYAIIWDFPFRPFKFALKTIFRKVFTFHMWFLQHARFEFCDGHLYISSF